MGYMHEELEDVTDHEVTLSDGEHLTRRGRYHRFFQYMSLFCFSMLGVVARRFVPRCRTAAVLLGRLVHAGRVRLAQAYDWLLH